jgi:hypothetical protein
VKKGLHSPLQALMDLFLSKGEFQQQTNHHEPWKVPIIDEDIQNVHIGSPCSDTDDPHTKKHGVPYYEIKILMKLSGKYSLGLLDCEERV